MPTSTLLECRAVINNIDFTSLFDQFQVQGEFDHVQPFGSGHINDTYLITTRSPIHHDYIYQRINADVFTNVPQLMNNISLVSNHLRHKLIARNIPHPEWHCLTVVPCCNGQMFYHDENNNYWAVYIYIPGQALDLVPSADHAYEGGKIFGQFLDMLSDIDINTIEETIPHFHNIDFRVKQFEQAIAEDRCRRKVNAIEQIAFIRDHSKQMRTILQLGQTGKIPLRIIHNDTKFNNVLLDKNGKALCVIDLDTVMPGYLHYDYSDAIRTGTATAKEDEADLSKVDIDLKLFDGFCRGFITNMHHSITETELAFLPLSTHLLPFIIGIRFLTDYINGDTYFKTHYDQQNLIRAKAQFQLVKQIDNKMGQIENIIHRIIDESEIA